MRRLLGHAALGAAGVAAEALRRAELAAYHRRHRQRARGAGR